MALKTNYTDAAWVGNRKYNMIENSDGTVSFEDVTEYISKENSFFGASDANQMNAILNTLNNYFHVTKFVEPTSSTLGYIQFSNDVVIIFGAISKTMSITQSWGNLYSSTGSSITIPFPIALQSVYSAEIQLLNANAWVLLNSVGTSGVSFFGVSGISKSYTGNVQVLAVGKI